MPHPLFKKMKLLPDDFGQHPGIYLSATMLAIIAIIYIFSIYPLLQQPIASTYEECVDQPDSKVMESYPSICITSDKQQFIQPTPTVQEATPNASLSPK
jgi:hypothetical protein